MINYWKLKNYTSMITCRWVSIKTIFLFLVKRASLSYVGTQHFVSCVPATPWASFRFAKPRPRRGAGRSPVPPTLHLQVSRSCEDLSFFHDCKRSFHKPVRCQLSCGAILLCALRLRAARALAFPPDFVSGRVPLLRVTRRAHFLS